MSAINERTGMTAGRMLCLGLGVAAVTVILAVFFMSGNIAAAQDNGDTPSDEPGTTPIDGRQPTVDNQFTTTSGGALQQRRPGLYVRQGIAVHDGDTSFFTGVPEEQPNFFRDTFDLLLEDAFFTPIQDFLEAFNFFIQSLSGSSGGSGGITFIPPANSVTTWQSGSVSVQ